MSGVLLLALCVFMVSVSWQDTGTDSEPVPVWDELPTAKNRLVKTDSSPGTPALSVAEGLSVERLPAIQLGRALGLASGRAGEVWILADTPEPFLPGGPVAGMKPQLIRFGKETGDWRETGRFPVPGGSRRLAAAGRDILLGAPGMVWRLSADKPDLAVPLLIQFRGVGEIPIPGIDEQGVAHVVVPSGVWSWKNSGAVGAQALDPSAIVPDSAWGMLRLPLWTGGRMEVHATGLTPETLWTTPTQEGEWILGSPGGRGNFLQVVRAGNELGFRQRPEVGSSMRRMPPGIGAVQPLVAFRGTKIKAGAWVTSSLGPDWRGTCWVAEPGRVTALSAPLQGSATRQAREKKPVFSTEGGDFLPVAMAEDAGGEGVWILTTGRDVVATGQLPLEPFPETRLLLVKNPVWQAERDATQGPLAPDADWRDQLGHVPDGPGRWAKARELAGEGGPRDEQLAALALDTSVSLSTRRAAWAGLAFAGKSGKWLGRMLGTDHSQLRASAARWCQSLARLAADSSESLLAAVQDADGAVSREAACAAALHRVPGVAESLAAALFQRDETDAQVQSANLHALGLLGREGAERMLSAAQTGVRAEAVRALRARVGFPWPADQGGAPELWLSIRIWGRITRPCTWTGCRQRPNRPTRPSAWKG
ncbi:MAG: HEAT repeat domain-containing protein, partial [Gemmataceae bacterium]